MNVKGLSSKSKKVKCPHCGSYNTAPLTKNFGQTVVKNAIFCYECGRESYHE